MLQDRIGAGLEHLVTTQDALLNVVPMGITLVTATGEVAHVNAYQSTFAQCPWVANPTINMLRDPAVPRPLRDGLRRIADGAELEHLRVAPLLFADTPPTLDTWLVPVRESGRVLATVIAQYAREAERAANGRPPSRRGASARASRICKPPRLDIPVLLEVFGLTPREVQLVDALCRGQDTAAIADIMNITPNTVKDYVKRVQRKMGVRNRLSIVSRALQVSSD